MNKIEVINGYKEYKKNKETILILKNINVNFESGKLYAIMGKSGAGKTTLLNILGTIDDLTNGTILIDKQDIKQMSEDEKAFVRMKKIGFVFQEFYLNPYMNLQENIMQPMFINSEFNKVSLILRTSELIKMIGLEERKKHFPSELSGGEQQRVAIARALANNPDIILADEPTGNLDKKNQQYIFEILKKLSKQGKCIIIVSHSNEVKKYADIIYYLEEGNLKKDEN